MVNFERVFNDMRSRIVFLIIVIGVCGVFGQDVAETDEAVDSEQVEAPNLSTLETGNNESHGSGDGDVGNDDDEGAGPDADGRDNEGSENNINANKYPENDGLKNNNIDSDDDFYYFVENDFDESNKPEENFYYPCERSDNITCVREYFAQKAVCIRVSHKDGKSIYRERQVTYLPNNNVTVIPTKTRITFYGTKIIEFYVNKRTDNLVMAVDFKGIYLESKFTYFLFERKAKEPLIYGDYLTANYTATLTAVIPVKRGLDIKQTRVTAYNTDGNPPFEIGPKISNSSNPVIAKSYNSLLEHVPTAVREIFLTESHNFFFMYLQWYICNFGLPISV